MARPTLSPSRRSTPNASGGASAAARERGIPAASSGAPDSPEPARFAIPINADGSLASDRMRDTTKETLRKIVTDPATATALGIKSNDAPTPTISPEMSAAIARGIAELDLAIVERATGASRDIIDQVRWNDVEIALLSGPIGKVVGKYGGGWLTKFEDEIALLILLFTITQVKIAMARQLMTERKTVSPLRVVPPTVAPQPIAPTDATGEPA